jgi:hypothetical protein
LAVAVAVEQLTTLRESTVAVAVVGTHLLVFLKTLLAETTQL